MITRIISKKDVIKQLESLKENAECMASIEDADEVFTKDVIALSAAIDCVKKRRREDVYIIKGAVLLTIVILALILLFWNMA
ncbi:MULTISPECIES: hypothetical protein [unclassified Clostridium]|uniref:hypothetical protein n=1 Tax=unclassified Clostridium TaxID=2614128 RepID=UPI000297B10B|nr:MULTISPECIES: hypothetical protein [unclassified Clostridium]EKQ50300.1 MAG: hypothetical protein A370_05746 [Clostridium sp. Maddingley MBC34-26]